MPAHALRISNFTAAAQNSTLTTLVQEHVESSCNITITNVSDVSQSVRFSIRLYATKVAGPGTCTIGVTPGQNCSGAGTDGLYTTITNASLGLPDPLILAPNSAALTTTNCSASSNTCTLPMSGNGMTYPMITAGNIVSQDVRCEGFISAENTTPGAQGFVLATGTLTTFVESRGGAALGFDPITGLNNGTAKNNTTAPTVTNIMIGEGRPF